MQEKNWTIRDIEEITEAEAAAMAEEKHDIKGHNVYLVDFGGAFGYSALVFANGHHIHYANDYALHHSGRTRDELRDWYLSTLNRKLFTEDELDAVTDYDDYRAKLYFLTNYYAMREDHKSAFAILRNDEQKKAYKAERAGMLFNPIPYAYYPPEKKDFVQHMVELSVRLEEAKRKNEDSVDYWKAAFLSEMFNHEYAINWQADWDVIGCFGSVSDCHPDDNLSVLFKTAGFTTTQKTAYSLARSEYMRTCGEY